MREVQACRAYYGTTPLEVLSKSVTLDERWSLVHATHATPAERSLVAAAGCVVVLCPTTEANLGDGIFAASDFVAGGGRIAIGSDSNVSLDVAEELRWLEYGQRLTLQRRGVLRSPGRSLAGGLFERCAKGGRQALAQPVGAFAPGSRADFVVLEEGDEQNGPSMNRYVFKSGAWRVRDVIVAGGYVVRDGHHAQEEAIRRRALRAAASIA
jgi:formimidoylglutamate deiminase